MARVALRSLCVFYVIISWVGTRAEQVGILDGKRLLVVFIPVHGRSDVTSRGSNALEQCGPLRTEDGIHFVEALYYTLDGINASGLLGDQTLGAVVFDTCGEPRHALNNAVVVLRSFIASSQGQRARGDNSDYQCVGSASVVADEVSMIYLKKTVGVVGGAMSGVSIHLAYLLGLFEMPQISYFATSVDLSDPQKFPFFKRTVPPDNYTALALVDIISYFNWTFVGVLSDNSHYGVQVYTAFQMSAAAKNICIGYSNQIGENWSDDKLEAAVCAIQRRSPRLRAVVLFLDAAVVHRVLQAARRCSLAGKIVWLGGDSWSGRQMAVRGLEDVVGTVVTVTPLAFTDQGFDTYFTNLNPKNNTRNPWFSEYWETYFNCSLTPPDIMSTTTAPNATTNYTSTANPFPASGNTRPQCTGKEKISEENGYRPLRGSHFIMDAVLAFAHALKLCTDCPLDMQQSSRGQKLNEYLRNINFTGASGRPFRFHDGAEGPPRYTVQAIWGNGTWRDAGEYTWENARGRLRLNDSLTIEMSEIPPSVCSEPCSSGEHRQDTDGDHCCWVCVPITCAPGFQVDYEINNCTEVDESYVGYDSAWSIASLCLACLGLILAFAVTAVFVAFYDSPIIKAAGRELCIYLLIGVYISFAATFVFWAKPTDVICGAKRLLLGLCYTITYAAILTKINRISRIFNTRGLSGAQRPRYIDPTSQVAITSLLVLVEVAVIVVWLVVSPPETTQELGPGLRVLVCRAEKNNTNLIPMCYPLALLVACAVYAFRTRRAPDGFNETRQVAFASYTTCVLWVAFVPVYFSTSDYWIKTFTMSTAMWINAIVLQGCVLAPKVYICLLRPAKNTKEAVMSYSGAMTVSSKSSNNRASGAAGSRTSLQMINPSPRPSPNVTKASKVKYSMSRESASDTLTLPLEDTFERRSRDDDVSDDNVHGHGNGALDKLYREK